MDNLYYGNQLEKIASYMSGNEISMANQCSEELLKKLTHQQGINQNKVLVAYGGGKDSSYMLAYVRFLQLLLLKKYQSTFFLRIATNRHAGMPYAVMENIDRVYRALGMYGDPLTEMLLIDGKNINIFNKDLPLPSNLKEQNRKDILMSGHRVQGDGRPTFCNACNLSMVNSFAYAAWYQGGVNMIITGDSQREQRAYYLWVNRLAKEFNTQKRYKNEKGFSAFIKNLDDISKTYFEKIHGEHAVDEINKRITNLDIIPNDPVFFSIFGHTDYSAHKHWDFLTQFLNFQFDELAFSFTESDCANPALMAHIRALKTERYFRRSYQDGILDYLKLSIKLMRDKDFPEYLILKAVERYLKDDGIKNMRAKLDQFAEDAFSLSEQQLVCMTFSPFVNYGENLSKYLEMENQGLKIYQENIVKLLSNDDNSLSDQELLIKELNQCSGLSFMELRTLFKDSTSSPTSSKSMIDRVLQDDPHKVVIKTQHHPQGPSVEELISGR